MGNFKGQTVKVEMPAGTEVCASVDLTEDGDGVTALRLRFVLGRGDAVQVKLPLKAHQGAAAERLVVAVNELRQAKPDSEVKTPAEREMVDMRTGRRG